MDSPFSSSSSSTRARFEAGESALAVNSSGSCARRFFGIVGNCWFLSRNVNSRTACMRRREFILLIWQPEVVLFSTRIGSQKSTSWRSAAIRLDGGTSKKSRRYYQDLNSSIIKALEAQVQLLRIFALLSFFRHTTSDHLLPCGLGRHRCE